MTKKFHISIALVLFITCTVAKSQEMTTLQVQQLLDEVELLQVQNQDKIDAAFAAMEAVQRAGAYIESISDLVGNGEITLPVGIKKGEYELIIQKLKYNEETGKTSIYATCAFTFKDNGQKVAFEGNTYLEGQRGLGTTGKLKLIAPVRRDIGDKAAIIFNSGTQANFGCEGIESYLAKINLIVTSPKIIAVDNDGNPSGNSLTSSFEANFLDFDNYTVSFSFGQSFSFKGLKDIVFTLKGSSLDQSDTLTPSTVHFPDSYFSGEKENEIMLWKGIAVTEATVALPAIFKKSSLSGDSLSTIDTAGSENADRIELTMINALFDDNGFTGNLSANDIMNSEAIDKTKWDITVNDFTLGLLKDQVNGFGFGGDINLPPLGKNSLLPYLATYNPSVEEYEFQVNVSGKYEFPVLRSSLSLNETSTIEVLFQDSEIYPTLNASGFISIDAPINKDDSTKKFSVPDIDFENMKISRAEPYLQIGAIGLTGDLVSPKVAGFEFSITKIRPFADSSGTGLAFDAGIKLNEMFGGQAGMQLFGDYAKWKFNKVGIDKVNVDFKSSAFSINGGVIFKNGDATYGNGFRGDLAFILIDKFKFDAVGIFGKKDDFRYFLTDVFFETSPTSGLTVPPALSFYGFGGGLYMRMQQSNDPEISSDFGKSLSGINYIPDNTVGMGFMTATKFSLIGTPSAFNAKVGFEIQFNSKTGGVNFIQLRGDGTFMDSPEKWGKLADNINQQTKKLEEAGGKIKLSAKSDLSVPENKSSGFLTASMNIKYDISNKVFTADLSTYLNAGFIKGIGENDRMGWASAYFSPDKWYTYIGTPSDRLGVKILGLATANGYFMVGNDIPELPLPPNYVLQNFSLEKQEKLNNRSTGNLASGDGIAFGQAFDVNFNATLPPFYAQLGVGLGAEFLLKNYGTDAYCAGSSTTLGINGWYARAQAWAYVNADIGMEAKVFSKYRKFSILDLTASALLAGAGPNPVYFTGAVGGQFKVMGGLISGKCDFDFEIGEECQIMGGSPFGDEIINQLTPSAGEKDVNVFAAPQAVFNIPVGLEMEIEEEDGQKAWYKITIEDFSVYYKDTKQKVDGNYELSQDGKVYMIDPSEPFESQKDMVVHAKVGFKRKLNDKWIDVTGADGKPVYEEKTAEYKSGDRPTVILPEHVKYSYPLVKQYNYYPDEYKNGYILITENYSYLFTTDKPAGFDQVLRITDFDGNAQETGFTFKTNSADNAIRFEIDFSTEKTEFNNDEIYKLAIVNVPQNKNVTITSNITSTSSSFDGNDSISVTKNQAEGNLEILEEKEVYAFNFRTSMYNKFVEKMNAVSNYEGVVTQEYPHVYTLGSNVYDPTTPTEIFDYYESNSLDADASLITITPLYNQSSWFTSKVNPLMYGNSDLLTDAKMTSLKPPVHNQVIRYALRTPDNRLTQEIIESNSRPYQSPIGAYHYRASYYIDQDYIALRNALANNLVRTGNASAGSARFLNTDNIPDMTNGIYEMQVNYSLPGKDIVTSTINRTIELEDFIDR